MSNQLIDFFFRQRNSYFEQQFLTIVWCVFCMSSLRCRMMGGCDSVSKMLFTKAARRARWTASQPASSTWLSGDECVWVTASNWAQPQDSSTNTMASGTRWAGSLHMRLRLACSVNLSDCVCAVKKLQMDTPLFAQLDFYDKECNISEGTADSLHPTSEIFMEKHYHLAQKATPYVRVWFAIKSMWMSRLFSPKLLMGLMRKTSTSMCVP